MSPLLAGLRHQGRQRSLRRLSGGVLSNRADFEVSERRPSNPDDPPRKRLLLQGGRIREELRPDSRTDYFGEVLRLEAESNEGEGEIGVLLLIMVDNTTCMDKMLPGIPTVMRPTRGARPVASARRPPMREAPAPGHWRA